MGINESDEQADFSPVIDRGEAVAKLEPLVIGSESSARARLQDLAMDVATQSAELRSSLPPDIIEALADLLRVMNCYYSNLIEGHDTHPYDIDRAQKKDYSLDPAKRDLQLEAEAHIAVQKWIDESSELDFASEQTICEIHRRFCDLLPPELRILVDPQNGLPVPVVPGEMRKRDVAVGRHVAVSPGALPRFMERYHRAYSGLNRIERIIATPAAHH